MINLSFESIYYGQVCAIIGFESIMCTKNLEFICVSLYADC